MRDVIMANRPGMGPVGAGDATGPAANRAARCDQDMHPLKRDDRTSTGSLLYRNAGPHRSRFSPRDRRRPVALAPDAAGAEASEGRGLLEDGCDQREIRASNENGD